MSRILITGSRDWTDYVAIEQALKVYGDEDSIIVHGACPTGADDMADDIARELGWAVERHPAEWYKNGKYDNRAGFIRNSEMVDLGASLCLAFIKNDSRGATMCAKLAMGTGIPTFKFIQQYPIS